MSVPVAIQHQCSSGPAVSPGARVALRSPGRSLDAPMRSSMERRFGQSLTQNRTPGSILHERAAEAEADHLAQTVVHAPARTAAASSINFGSVRIHDDSGAAESARAQNAAAYAVGQHIVFGRGQYQPGTSAGRSLLAHELAHTLQQRAGGRETVQKKDAEPPTAASETTATIFPYARDTKVKLGIIFQDSLFDHVPNHITTWVRGVQEQDLTVTEASADRFNAKFAGPVIRRGPGVGPPGPPLLNVRVSVERVGSGRFKIAISSDAKVLAAQETRATQNAHGATVLAPVAPKSVPLPSAGKPASKDDDFAKSDMAPLPGLESPSKSDQDKANFDSLTKPPATEAAAPSPPPATSAAVAVPAPAAATGLSKEDEDTLTKAGETMAKAFFKLGEGKRLAEAASKVAEKLPTVVMVVAPATLVAAAFAGMVATKSESPIKESPDIPLPKIGSVEMKAKVTFKGPGHKPTEASITLTFATGSLEVAAAFKRTWADSATPVSADNKTATEAGLSIKIPLGTDPAKQPEPTDTEKVRAEIDRLREQDALFKKGINYKPGSAEANAEALERKAADDAAQKHFKPSASGADGSAPWVLQTFDPRPGPGKIPWDIDQLSKLIGAALNSSPGATLHVVVTYLPVAADTDQARVANAATHDTAVEEADLTKRALEQWLPVTKGRIRTSVEFKPTSRTFGLSSDDLARVNARGAAVILIPGATTKQ